MSSDNKQPDVLIVGGGISGLSLAWWITQLGLQVEVWESNDRTGGKIQSTQQNGYLFEQAANMVMNFKPEVSQLMDQSGLANLKTPRHENAESRRYLLQKNTLHALPMKMQGMLSSSLWSWQGKLRLLAEPFMPKGKTDTESVSTFIKRRLGSEMLEKAMEPFIAGTLASDPDLANATATLPRLTALEKKYGSITAGVLLHKLIRKRTACVTESFSFQGGMSTLINNLSNTPGVIIKKSYKAKELIKRKNNWLVYANTPSGYVTRVVPQVVLATPATAAAQLVSTLDTTLQNLLNTISYAPLSVVHLGFDRSAVGHPLDGTGFLSPRGERHELTGNLWMSSLFPDRAPAGKVLLTAYMGGARSPHVAGWNKEQTIATAIKTLRPLLKLKADPEMVHVIQHQQALPLYNGAYPARLLAIDDHLQQFPGLYLEANYRGGVSVRDRIVRGKSLANEIYAQHLQLSKRMEKSNSVSSAEAALVYDLNGI